MAGSSRVLLFLFALGVCITPVYAEESDYMPEQDENKGWTATQGTLDGRPAFLRIQNGIDQATRARNPHRVTIAWKYPDNGDDGMPPIELKDRFHELEDALDNAIIEDGTGVLSLVLTTAGRREWHVHFSETKDLQASINNAFAELPEMPITLTAEFDPDWSDYNYFISTLVDL